MDRFKVEVLDWIRAFDWYVSETKAKMDPFTIAIALASVAGISGMILVVMKVGLGNETNFAEKIEKQRQILEESETRNKKQKPKDKKKKEKKVKKEIEGVSGSEMEMVDASGDEQPHAHVEYDPDPIILTEETKPAKKEKEVHLEVENVKSILKNREEYLVVRATAPAETHFTHVPKDDAQIAHDKKTKKDKKKDKKKVEKVEPVITVPEPVAEEQVVVEEVIVTQAVMVSSSAPTYSAPAPAPEPSEAVKSRRSKKSHMADEWTLNKLLDKIQSASLTHDDIQVLIDELLARQTSGDNWTTKGAKADPMTILKKQKEDLELALDAEKSSAESGRIKIKELQSKIQTVERENQMSQLKYTSEKTAMMNSIEKMKKEIQVAQQSRYEDSQKLQQLQTHIQQLTEQNSAMKKTLPEANDMSMLKNELTTLQQAIAGLETERDNLTKQNRMLESARTDLSQQLNDARQRSERNEKQQSRAADAELNLRNVQDQLKSQQMDSERAAGEQQRVIAERDQQVQSLQNELSSLQTELNTVKSAQVNGNLSNGSPAANGDNNIQQLEEEMRKLASDLKDRDGQIDSYTKQLSTMKSKEDEILGLREELKAATQLSAQHAELSSKNTELTTQHAGLTTQLAELTTQLAELKTQHAELQTQHAELQTQHAELQTQHAELSTQHAGLSTQLGELTTQNAELQTQHAELSTQHTELSTQLGELTTQNAELTTQYAELSAKHAELTTKHAELTTKHADLGAQHADLSSQNAELGSQNAEISAKYSKLSAQLDELSAQLSASQPHLTELNKTVESLRAERETLTGQLAEKSELSNRLESLTADKTKMSDKNNDLRRKNWALSDQLNQAETKLNQSVQLYNELSSKVEGLTNEKNELVEKLSELKSNLSQKDVEINSLQKSASKPQPVVDESKLKTLEQLNRTLQSQLDRANSDKQSLTSRLQEAESQATSEEDSPEKYREALKQVDSLLVGLTTKIETELSDWSGRLSNKDQEVMEVKQALSFKEKELSSQINILKNKVDSLQSDNQSAAAQMAASGDSNDNGTCV